MSENKYSPLTTLRFNIDNGKQPILEVWDPEAKTVCSISSEQLSNVENIHNALTSIKSSIQDKQQRLIHYARWMSKGWHKSIDYYVASRSDINEFELASEHHHSNPPSLMVIEHSKLHSVPQAMIQRKTKRGFRTETIQNQIFSAALEKGCATVYEGFELYLIVYDVEKIAPGVYSYDVKNNSLLLVREGLFAEEMSCNIQGMRTPKTACFSIILVADFKCLQRSMPHPRGLRNTYIEAGRLAQNLVISYMQHSVFCLVTPALRDRDVSTLLKLKEPDFSPLYSLTFGYPIT